MDRKHVVAQAVRERDVLIEFRSHTERRDDVLVDLGLLLVEGARRPGCELMRLLSDVGDPTLLLLITRWTSDESRRRFVSWYERFEREHDMRSKLERAPAVVDLAVLGHAERAAESSCRSRAPRSLLASAERSSRIG